MEDMWFFNEETSDWDIIPSEETANAAEKVLERIFENEMRDKFPNFDFE
jgi:hypothetical protein